MKFNLNDVNKAYKGAINYEEDLKEARKTINKLLNGKDIDRNEVEFLHQTIEGIWYGDKIIRGEW